MKKLKVRCPHCDKTIDHLWVEKYEYQEGTYDLNKGFEMEGCIHNTEDDQVFKCPKCLGFIAEGLEEDGAMTFLEGGTK